MLNNSDIEVVPFQGKVWSRILRRNYANIKNAVNDLYNQIAGIQTSATNAETVAARDYSDDLKSRLDFTFADFGSFIVESTISEPFKVTEDSPASMKVNINGGDASVNGVFIHHEGAELSGTLTAPATNPRFDVVVLNSDSTISVLTGTASADPVLPAVASSQRALAILTMTPGMTTIPNSAIFDCRGQGAMAFPAIGPKSYHWLIQDAIDAAGSNGRVEVSSGRYYEELDLSGLSNFKLDLGNANIYRPTATARALKCINTAGNEKTNIRVAGGNFYGNSKSGAYELIILEYTNNIILNNFIADSNSSATATNKIMHFENCLYFLGNGIINESAINPIGQLNSQYYEIKTNSVNFVSSKNEIISIQGAQTQNAIYDFLQPYMKGTGTIIPVTGAIYDGTKLLTISFAQKAASAINFIGTNGTTFTIVATDGDATVWDVAITLL
jgi:hypothetical protein